MMDTSTETKRARLLNLARGGNGHCDTWIERVTVRCPGEDDRPGFVVHLPSRYDLRELTIHLDSLEDAQNLIIALKVNTQPPKLDPIDIDEAVKLLVPEDHGRIVTADGETLK